jgi:glycosyltransferase involved in cell wall biosynthesis
MNNKVAILTPTYGRPHRIQPYIDNIRSVTNMDLADIVFIVEEDDKEVREICENSGETTIINKRARSFGGAMNTAVRELDYKYFYGSSDDFFFHENWLPPLLELSENFGMVGSNDMGNPEVAAGLLSTCYLINKKYLSRCVPDSPEDIVCELYLHNYTDTELTSVARFNKEYAYCPESLVEHMHPAWGKAPIDETYNLQNGTWDHDTALFNSRRFLWEQA